jgi:orotidine-5'-phosphate decarboxylase
VHASGGRAMMRAARAAAGPPGSGAPLLFAVTLLTSLSESEVAESWGRRSVQVPDEVRRLSSTAAAAGMDGVVASVHEAAAIRQSDPGLALLTPGIRLPGDASGDQARVATPDDAARAGVEFLVIGRSVTHAPDPALAWDRVLDGIIRGGGGVQRSS